MTDTDELRGRKWQNTSRLPCCVGTTRGTSWCFDQSANLGGTESRHFDSGASRRRASAFEFGLRFRWSAHRRGVLGGGGEPSSIPRRPAPALAAPRRSQSKFVSARALLLISHSRRQTDVPRLIRRHRHASSGETCASATPTRVMPACSDGAGPHHPAALGRRWVRGGFFA